MINKIKMYFLGNRVIKAIRFIHIIIKLIHDFSLVH